MSLAMFAAVGAGGALGAMSRYAVAQLVGGGLFGIAGPMATLVVNVAGSSLMGALAGGIAAGMALPEAWRGFMAVLYVGLSVGLSLAAFFVTQALVTALLGRMPG